MKVESLKKQSKLSRPQSSMRVETAARDGFAMGKVKLLTVYTQATRNLPGTSFLREL
jgi:hypothetical protein